MVAGLAFATFAFRLTPFCGLPRVGGGDSAGGGDSDEDSGSGEGEERVEGGGERDEVSDEAVIFGTPRCWMGDGDGICVGGVDGGRGLIV